MKVHSVIFYTNDISNVKAFYLEIIGLSLDYERSNYISFNFPDGIKLGIKLHTEDREIPGAQTVFLETENIDEVYKRLKEMKVTFSKELKEEKWALEFAVLDPDGNKLTFRKSYP